MFNENVSELIKTRPVGEIENKVAGSVAWRLNQILANEYALFTKTLNYHWNVTGPRFHSLHNFLEIQYKDLLETMDDVAERIRTLGETPLSTVKEMYSYMDLNEFTGKELSSSEMIADLFKVNLNIQKQIKDTLENEKESFETDLGSEDFLVSLLQKHELISWKLKSHLD